MIIGITGTNGAGKGTVVEYLKSKGFAHYSVREELVKEIQRRGLAVDRSSMRTVANEIRAKETPDYFVRLFLDRARAEGVHDCVIESIRNVGEARTLCAEGGLLIAVDAERRLRYERILRRGSATDHVDYETWVAQEEREWNNSAAYDMDIPAVMQLADIHIANAGDLAELHAKLDTALASAAA